MTVISQGNDDFPLAKVECLPADGKYRTAVLFRKTVFGKPSHFMLKWVFPKLSNEIPCLTPSYIGTLIERAKEKSIPYKDTDKKKLTPLEDGQKVKALHL